MAFLPFVILATLAYCILSGGWWGWMRGPGVAPYAPFANGFGLFLLACEILWLVFGANSGCLHS
jgi:hypothetical protein